MLGLPTGQKIPPPESTPLDIAASEPRRTTIEGIVALEGTAAELPDALILRYGLFYGPGTWFAPDGLRADDARAGKLVADGAVSSFVHVDDAAAVAVQALGWPGGPVNVCDNTPAAAQEWVPAFCDWVGAPSPSAGADRPRSGPRRHQPLRPQTPQLDPEIPVLARRLQIRHPVRQGTSGKIVGERRRCVLPRQSSR